MNSAFQFTDRIFHEKFIKFAGSFTGGAWF